MSGDPKDNRQDEGQADVAAELLAHPLALPAIATTIGMGIAGQMLGFWVGAVSRTLKAGHLISEEQLLVGGTAADMSSLAGVASKPSQNARPAHSKASQAASNVVSLTSVRKAKGQGAAEVPVPANDDLKSINGVGPKLEQMLNKLGVTSFAQMAAWTKADIDRIEKHFGFPGRIERDGWVAEASARAVGKARS